MFHVGHVKLLEKAKGICNILIVGVHPDDVIFKNKNKYPIIPFEQRIEIVRTNKYVDVAVEDKEYTYSKNLINKYKINMFIIGDDYFGKWDKIEKELEENGAKLIYLPYTKSQSSTEIRQKLKDK